jgi:hypothetical protein
MKENILLPMKDISSRTNKLKSLCVFDKMFKFLDVKDGKCLQFKGILNVKWIMVPSILKVILLM